MWTQAHDSSSATVSGVSSAAVAGPSAETADPTYNVDDSSLEHELEAELKALRQGKRPLVRRGQTTKQFMDDMKRAERQGLGI